MRKSDAFIVIENGIAAHGWNGYNQGVVSFRHENILYRMLKDGDAYLFSRTFEDSTGQRIHDVLATSGFTRYINDVEVPLNQEESAVFSEDIRAVVLFALLPYSLKEGNMQEKYLGSMTLKGQPYHKIRITYTRKTGNAAEPIEGDYVLWFNEDKHTLDYVVYAPLGGKTRNLFCQAVNQRTIGNINFQDYDNFATTRRISPVRLDYAFEADKLDKVSETRFEEIYVGELPPL